MGGLLVVMGSGETAPTMVKPHRAIFERVGDAPAVLLDTPYGFQENADDITAKAIAYFAASVGRPVSALSWRGTPPPRPAPGPAPAPPDQARWVFAGPRSPTHAPRPGAEFDLDARTVTVTGRGGFTVRRHGTSAVYPTGSVVSFDALLGLTPAAPPPVVKEPEAPPSTGSLRADADRLEEVFAAAYAA